MKNRTTDVTSENPDIFLSVSELNQLARLALEKGLPSCRVQGEISNFMRAGSGHWYFTLKDDQASVRCVMFRARNQFVDWLPRDGDRVELRAQPSLYEQRGDFQLLVEAMRQGGQGTLFEAFARLKAKLQAEGLFAPERKRPIPLMPHTLGIITSPQAAALRDVLSTVGARWPASSVILYPSQVQGEGAPASLVQAFALACARSECDVLLLVRGGGSLEDLIAFNNEAVARAIAGCSIPVISGVGHETDFTIADFVADLRAPTPSGAAQAATPSKASISTELQHLATRRAQALQRKLDAASQRLDNLSRRVVHPRERISAKRHELRHAALRLAVAVESRLRSALTRHEKCRVPVPAPMIRSMHETVASIQDRLRETARFLLTERAHALHTHRARLALLNPTAVLSRGYSIVRDRHMRVIRNAAAIGTGTSVHITLAKGRLEAKVVGSFADEHGPDDPVMHAQ